MELLNSLWLLYLSLELKADKYINEPNQRVFKQKNIVF